MHRASCQIFRITVLSVSCLLIFLLAQANVVSAQGDNPAQSERMLRRDLAKIDNEILELTNKREALRLQLDDGASFSRQASGWFDKLNRLNQEIRDVENHPHDTYKGENKQALLAKLKKERGVLASLNGGTVIDGLHYTSIQQLKGAFDDKVKETTEVLKKYNKLIAELETLHRKRDAMQTQLRNVAGKEADQLRKDIQHHEAAIEHMQYLINDKDLWVIPPLAAAYRDKEHNLQFDGYPYADKNLLIMTLLVTHRERGKLDGTGVDLEEYKKQVAKLRQASIWAKQVMRDEQIPRQQQELAELRHQLAMLEKPEADITGCWAVLLPGSRDLPVVMIVDREQGTYDGHIHHRGSLIKQYRKNYRLFRVQRTSDISFGGTERSYTSNGGIVNVPLRLTVNPDGRSITYASDETIQLQQTICK